MNAVPTNSVTLDNSDFLQKMYELENRHLVQIKSRDVYTRLAGTKL